MAWRNNFTEQAEKKDNGHKWTWPGEGGPRCCETTGLEPGTQGSGIMSRRGNGLEVMVYWAKAVDEKGRWKDRSWQRMAEVSICSREHSCLISSCLPQTSPFLGVLDTESPVPAFHTCWVIFLTALKSQLRVSLPGTPIKEQREIPSWAWVGWPLPEW